MCFPKHRNSQLITLFITPLISKSDLHVLNDPFSLAIILLISMLHMRQLPRITQLENREDQNLSVYINFPTLSSLPLSHVCQELGNCGCHMEGPGAAMTLKLSNAIVHTGAPRSSHVLLCFHWL